MTIAFSTTYTALKASISRKEISKLRKFDEVKLKLYKTTCRNNRIIPYFIKFKFSKFLKFKTYNQTSDKSILAYFLKKNIENIFVK